MRSERLAAGIVILAAVGVWQVGAGQRTGAGAEGDGDTAGLIEHGEYLVNAATMCGDCHTPRDDRGGPDRARRLRGATLPIRPRKETRDWADESPDITASGLAGRWGEGAMVRFLTTGINPDGKKAMPPMPAFRLNARDARAVALYLRSVPGGKESGKGAGGKGPG
jgi:mono/diheme cytochrome c family protein